MLSGSVQITKDQMVLSRIVWIEIQTITEEEHSNSEMFKGAVSSTHAFDLLKWFIYCLRFRVGL